MAANSQPENKKPKLSNKPTPKEPKKAKGGFVSKLVTLISIGVIGFALFTMKQHADATQRAPWNWDNQDWVNYLTLSRQTAETAAKDIQDRVNKIDWEKIRAKITEKTQRLWNSAQDLEKRIEKRLDQEKNKKVEIDDSASTNSDTNTAVAPKPTKKATKGHYQKGLEAMKKAILMYRKSPPGGKDSKAHLTQSEADFRKAQDHLQRAIDEVPSHQKPDVEDLLQECQQYLYDCQKRKTL